MTSNPKCDKRQKCVAESAEKQVLFSEKFEVLSLSPQLRKIFSMADFFEFQFCQKRIDLRASSLSLIKKFVMSE